MPKKEGLKNEKTKRWKNKTKMHEIMKSSKQMQQKNKKRKSITSHLNIQFCRNTTKMEDNAEWDK